MERLLSIFNYGMILLFGVFLSVLFAGGSKSHRDRLNIFLFSVFTLCMQTSCSFLVGLSLTTKLYPLITHLPLILFLVLALKKPICISIVSVMTAYFCCQLPHWAGALSQQFFHGTNASLLTYSIATIVFFFLIWHFFAESAYQAMSYSRQSLFLLGCLPTVYYIFDYATTVYTSVLYTGSKMMIEFLPTVMILFYLWFIIIYHSEVQQKSQIQLEKNMLSMQMETAKLQLNVLRSSQEQSVIYRHDMRHHLSLINSFVLQGDLEKIKDYLSHAEKEMRSFTPLRLCENETVNLILSSFISKAQKQDTVLHIKAVLPKEINIPDTELCSVLSNGLENALNAVSQVEDKTLRKVFVDCNVNRDIVLIKIENAYTGDIQIEGNTPLSKKIGHGYGYQSMRSIAEKRNGLCTFNASDGIFTLRLALPMEKVPPCG